MVHPLRTTVEALEAAASQPGSEAGAGVAGLAPGELHELVMRAWRVIQQIQGGVLLVLIAEAAHRELFRRREYASASSMRDLVAGWLRCSPTAAARLLWLARHVVNGTYGTTGRALATGEIDVDHARAVVRSVRALPAGVLDEAQRARAESTMLDTAKVVDAEVTATAGRRLLEILAPEAAQEQADRRAERERERAESSRWMEVTGFGIAGAKEFRLRAESGVIDALMRVVTPLVQASPRGEVTDAEPSDVSGVHDVDSANAYAFVDGRRNGAETPGDAAGVDTHPIERRRADAMVEVIDAIARPDLLDGLTAVQLRSLADQIEASDPPLTQDQGGGDKLRSGDACDEAKGADGTFVDGVPSFESNAYGVDVGQIITESCADAGGPASTGGHHDANPTARIGGTVGANAPHLQRDIERTASPQSDGRGSGRVRSRGARPGPRAPRNRPMPAASDRTARRVRDARNRVRGERPSLVVLADYDTARGRVRAGEVSSTGSPARLASVTEIEWEACEAMITPVWMSAGATPVEVAAPTRFFRGKQLAALIARDRGCAFPGCSRGLRYAHAHHIERWSEGGPTSVDNGVLLCSYHHRLIHRDDSWVVRLAGDKRPEFIPPPWIDPRRQPLRHTRHTRLPAAA